MVSKILKKWTFELVGTGQHAYQAAVGERFQRINIRNDESYEDGPFQFHVIILDFQMPSVPSDMVKGGIETAEKIREYEKVNGLPSIPIFGFTSDEISDEMRADLIGRGVFMEIFAKEEYVPLQLALESAIPSKT